MKLVYARDMIAEVPARWMKQYAHYPRDHRFPAASSIGARSVAEIESALRSAGDDIDAIKAVLPSWCEHDCDECGAHHEVLVRLGEEPDYEARWQDLCEACVRGALTLLIQSSTAPTDVDAEGGHTSVETREANNPSPNPPTPTRSGTGSA